MGLDRVEEAPGRHPGHHQPDQIELEHRIHPPADQASRQHRGGPCRGERDPAPLRQLEHEEAAHQRNAHQGRDAGGATADRQRPHQLAQTRDGAAQPAAGGHPHVRSRRLGAHRRPQPHGGQDCQGPKWSEVPRESLLRTGGVDHVAGEIRPGDVVGERIPRGLGSSCLGLAVFKGGDRLHRLALPQPEQNQHRQADAEQGQNLQPGPAEAGGAREAELDQLGEQHGGRRADQAPEQACRSPGEDLCRL